MEIRIDRESATPVYRQISQFISQMILHGDLPEGYRLPPERLLARSLGVNRTTVMNAYAELKADGLIDGRVGDGTRVAAAGKTAIMGSGAHPLRWSDLMRPSTRAGDQNLRDLLALSENRDSILLSLGFPAPELLPAALLRRGLDEILTEQGAGPYAYGPAEGMSTFREALSGLMGARGSNVSAGEILVTSGAQQAIDLVTRALVEPGDAVIVEEPTYIGALQVFRGAQARVISVPLDREGMRLDALETILTRFQPKLIYTLPTFQNPSGRLMGTGRRSRLLELAYRYRVPILEDDVYSDIWFDSPPPPSLHAIDPLGHVVYASSFSKALCPGLRVGWLVAPRPIFDRLVQIKQAADLQTPTLSQLLVERLLRAGLYTKHVDGIRRKYRDRRDAMEEALRKYGSDWAEWSPPRGGFYIWCRIKSVVPVRAVASAAADGGVSILPGDACVAGDGAADFARLSYSYADPARIGEGIARLAETVRKLRTRGPAPRAGITTTRPVV